MTLPQGMGSAAEPQQVREGVERLCVACRRGTAWEQIGRGRHLSKQSSAAHPLNRSMRENREMSKQQEEPFRAAESLMAAAGMRPMLRWWARPAERRTSINSSILQIRRRQPQLNS